MKHARPDYDRIQDPAGAIPADEPVFLLRAQDELSARIVDYYAEAYLQNGGDKETAMALMRHAQKMRQWPCRRFPTVPTPGG